MAASPSTEPRHVAVVGAGIVGVASALWLRRAGHRVTLVDRVGPAGGASHGNAGILAACAVVPVTVPGLVRKAPRLLLSPEEPLKIRWPYLPRLLPWLARYLSHATAEDARAAAAALTPLLADSLADHRALAAGTPAERWIHAADYVFVYRDRAAWEAERFTWDLRRANGFAWDELDATTLARAEPALAPDQRFAIRLPGHGRISDPGRYVRDLATAFEAEGGRILTGEVQDIARENGRVTGLRLAGETLPCDAAVIATGAWSGTLAKTLGLRFPIESERGYHLDLWGATTMPRAPLMIASAKMAMTPMEGRLRITGVLEFGGLAARPRADLFQLIERQARRILPGLTWDSRDRWMGHRPAPVDSIPAIGPVPGLAGAYLAAGHHHVGLTGGAATGRLVAQIVTGRRPNVDTAPYDPARFAA